MAGQNRTGKAARGRLRADSPNRPSADGARHRRWRCGARSG
jgi:hypothetical protein